MEPNAFRFTPPNAPLSPEAEWVVTRAFSDRRRSAAPPDAGRALRLARLLGLSARIAWRAGEDLKDELGAGAARPFEEDRLRVAARELAFTRLTERIAPLASELGLPWMLLKGMALIEAGAVGTGVRPMSDVDVLAPADRAEELWRQLQLRCKLSETPDDEAQHLPPLADPSLGVLLEIHDHLPGVRVAGSAATLGGLVSAGHSRPARDGSTRLLPSPAALAAHAIAHGLAQHGGSPGAYPTLKVVADLLDLGDRFDGLESLVAEARDLLEGTVSSRELVAVAELGRRLATGEGDLDEGDGGDLLRHAIAGATDPRYQRRLRLRALLRAVAARDWSRLGRRLRDARRGAAAVAGGLLSRTYRKEPAPKAPRR